MKKIVISLLFLSALFEVSHASSEHAWLIDSQAAWEEGQQLSENVEIVDGQSKSMEATSTYASVVKRYSEKRALESIIFKQTTAWDNWQEIEKVGVPEMDNAPVFVPVKDGDYWLLAMYQPVPEEERRVNGKWLKDSRPGEEKGYHAWHSTDMKNWVRKGPVSSSKQKWVTTAEYMDGTFYIYYDNPNDEDPHLILDSDLNDGKMGKDMGMVFEDPSHGSDCAVLREEDGCFHLIYENWDPIDASTHAWDSPLAGHAVSPDGINDFEILEPAVDHRTTPTGKYGEYVHGTTKRTYEYEIHEPEQNAYGDWTAIKIGGQYYLFCDYDPAGRKIRIGRFTSDSLDGKFELVGELGEGHPDPTIGFAEGQFYLIRQRAETDFISPGPWVAGVEARVGVDTSGNGDLDTWTDWQEVKETYAQKPGFVRIVEKTPASLDLSDLPEGYGFGFEYRTRSIPEQQVNVVMESVELTFSL